jgi:hypothetical protein
MKTSGDRVDCLVAKLRALARAARAATAEAAREPGLGRRRERPKRRTAPTPKRSGTEVAPMKAAYEAPGVRVDAPARRDRLPHARFHGRGMEVRDRPGFPVRGVKKNRHDITTR